MVLKELKVKRVTKYNWLEAEKQCKHLVWVDAQGNESMVSAEGFVEAIGAASISSKVPKEVEELFEVARGTLCYGYYFYPLYALGDQQLYRVLEAALSQKCKQMQDDPSYPAEKASFKKKLDWLRRKGCISENRYTQWDSARNLRNHASHPTSQSLIPPTMAILGTKTAAELINELYQS